MSQHPFPYEDAASAVADKFRKCGAGPGAEEAVHHRLLRIGWYHSQQSKLQSVKQADKREEQKKTIEYLKSKVAELESKNTGHATKQNKQA